MQESVSPSAGEETVPHFSWDRALSVGELKERLRTASGLEWVRLAAWIMREASFPEVWQFLSPAEVAARLAELEPFLGRRKAFWKYIIGAWYELGKI